MIPSAPVLNECIICSIPVDDYSDKIINKCKTQFSEVEEFKIFLIKYEDNPKSENFNVCLSCLIKKWQNINKKNQEARTREKERTTNIINLNHMIIFALLLLIGFASPYLKYLIWTDASESFPIINEDRLKSTILKVKDQFPSLQKNLLKKINGGLLRLKKPGEPFVLLLLHDDTNKDTTDCLASYTTIVAKQNIFTNTAKSLWMNASDWAQFDKLESDYQDLLYEKLIKPLQENEVLVLENLQDLPWTLAQSLHHLCDTENPQIAKAMFILELRVNGDGLQRWTDGEKMIAAEQALETAWAGATNSYRAALVTRLTSYVDAVLLKSDEGCLNKEMPLRSDKSFIRISP